MPLEATPLMAAHIVDIPGFKLPNLIAGSALLFFLAGPAFWPPKDRLERNALIAFLVYLALFSIAFARSLPHIARFHALFPDGYQANVSDYVQSYFVVKVLFALSFVYVLERMCSNEGILHTVSAIAVAMFILSCAVIAVLLTHESVIWDPDPGRNSLIALTQDSLGMHYNTIGTIYVITGPLLLFMAIKRGSLWSANFALALVAVLLLKSRTAILAFAGFSALTLIVLGRARTLLAFAPVAIAGALFVLGRMLVQLLTMGITKSGISTYALLSGREQAIWLPLLAEWISDRNRLLFGEGLFGVMSSNFLYSARSIFAAGEAHNFYLEFFLDNGIVLFAGFMAALVIWLRWGWRTARRLRSQLFWVLFLCVAAFLVAGLTGRRYLPEAENMLMFPILATMINVARLKMREERKLAAVPDRAGAGIRPSPR